MIDRGLHANRELGLPDITPLSGINRHSRFYVMQYRPKPKITGLYSRCLGRGAGKEWSIRGYNSRGAGVVDLSKRPCQKVPRNPGRSPILSVRDHSLLGISLHRRANFWFLSYIFIAGQFWFVSGLMARLPSGIRREWAQPRSVIRAFLGPPPRIATGARRCVVFHI